MKPLSIKASSKSQAKSHASLEKDTCEKLIKFVQRSTFYWPMPLHFLILI